MARIAADSDSARIREKRRSGVYAEVAHSCVTFAAGGALRRDSAQRSDAPQLFTSHTAMEACNECGAARAPVFLCAPDASYAVSYCADGARCSFGGDIEAQDSYEETAARAQRWAESVRGELRAARAVLPSPLSCFFHRPAVALPRRTRRVRRSAAAERRERERWGAQLVPQEPLPQLYARYEDYSAALVRWCSAAGAVAVAPPERIFGEGIARVSGELRRAAVKEKEKAEWRCGKAADERGVEDEVKMGGILKALWKSAYEVELRNAVESGQMMSPFEGWPKRSFVNTGAELTLESFLELLKYNIPCEKYSMNDITRIFNYVKSLIAKNCSLDDLINYVFRNNIYLYKFISLCSNGFSVNVSLINPCIDFLNNIEYSQDDTLSYIHKILIQNYLLEMLYIIFPNNSKSLKFYFDNNREQCSYVFEIDNIFDSVRKWLLDILNENSVEFVFSFIYMLLFYDFKIVNKVFPGEFGLILDKIHQINPKTFSLYQILSFDVFMKALMIDFFELKTFKKYQPSEFYYILMENVMKLNYFPPEIKDLKLNHIILIFSIQNNNLVFSLFYSITRFIKHNISSDENIWQNECLKLFWIMLDRIYHFPNNIEGPLNVCSEVLKTIKKCNIFEGFNPKMLILFSSLNHSDVNVRYIGFKCLRQVFLCLGDDFTKIYQIKEYYNEIQKAFERKEPVFIISIAKLIRKIILNNNNQNQSIFSLSKAINPITNILKANSISIKKYIRYLVNDPIYGFFKKEMVCFLHLVQTIPHYILK